VSDTGEGGCAVSWAVEEEESGAKEQMATRMYARGFKANLLPKNEFNRKE
jgi:hypothetical protein